MKEPDEIVKRLSGQVAKKVEVFRILKDRSSRDLVELWKQKEGDAENKPTRKAIETILSLRNEEHLIEVDKRQTVRFPYWRAFLGSLMVLWGIASISFSRITGYLFLAVGGYYLVEAFRRADKVSYAIVYLTGMVILVNIALRIEYSAAGAIVTLALIVATYIFGLWHATRIQRKSHEEE